MGDRVILSCLDDFINVEKYLRVEMIVMIRREK
jgi:hypothetical protein